MIHFMINLTFYENICGTSKRWQKKEPENKKNRTEEGGLGETKYYACGGER